MKNNAHRAREKTKRRARSASKGQIPMFQVSSDERLDSEDESESYSDYGNVQLGAIAMKPYQDKPRRTMGISQLRPRLAEVGDGWAGNEDIDGIPIATLESRYEI